MYAIRSYYGDALVFQAEVIPNKLWVRVFSHDLDTKPGAVATNPEPLPVFV